LKAERKRGLGPRLFIFKEEMMMDACGMNENDLAKKAASDYDVSEEPVLAVCESLRRKNAENPVAIVAYTIDDGTPFELLIGKNEDGFYFNVGIELDEPYESDFELED
jgi:hypothetical protein